MRKLNGIEVLDRVYFIHVMAGWKDIRTLKECNSFARCYTMPRLKFNDFYRLVTGNEFKREGYYMYERLIDRCLYSIDSIIWVCTYIDLVASIISLEKLNSSYFDLMFDKEINYPDYTFSEKFRSIRTLLSFYKSLLYNWSEKELCCNYLISIDNINSCLKDVSNLKEKDIESDLNNHGVISKISSTHYEWINLTVLKWLDSTPSSRLFEFNQYKLLKDL